MTDGKHPTELRAERRSRLDPSTVGTYYCIASAVSYTMMGICMRSLSESCDPVWVNCVQASVGMTVMGAYLVATSARGRSYWPPLPVAAALILLGVVTQLGGSSYQWSLGRIGLAICLPLQMGTMLSGSALLGLMFLRERVSLRGLAAIAVIIGAVVFLSFGASEANEVITGGGAFLAFWGVAAAVFSGLAFAILTVGVRKSATSDTAPVAIVFFINLMGLLFLGPWSLQRIGVEGVLATTSSDLATMLAVGGFNLVGFLLLTKSLQLTTVVRVTIVNNALATFLSVLAGIMLFAEPSSRNMLAGMVLTLVGVVLIGSTEGGDEQQEQTSYGSSTPVTLIPDEDPLKTKRLWGKMVNNATQERK